MVAFDDHGGVDLVPPAVTPASWRGESALIAGRAGPMFGHSPTSRP
jgi:hypothetical protein